MGYLTSSRTLRTFLFRHDIMQVVCQQICIILQQYTLITIDDHAYLVIVSDIICHSLARLTALWTRGTVCER